MIYEARPNRRPTPPACAAPGGSGDHGDSDLVRAVPPGRVHVITYGQRRGRAVRPTTSNSTLEIRRAGPSPGRDVQPLRESAAGWVNLARRRPGGANHLLDALPPSVAAPRDRRSQRLSASLTAVLDHRRPFALGT
jgi:hypothetical protein